MVYNHEILTGIENTQNKGCRVNNMAEWVKALVQQACRPQFDPQNPHKDGKREPLPQSSAWGMYPLFYPNNKHFLKKGGGVYSLTRVLTLRPQAGESRLEASLNYKQNPVSKTQTK